MRKMCKVLLSSVMAIVLLAGCGANVNTSSSEQAGDNSKVEATTANIKMFISQPRLKEQWDSFIADWAAKVKAEKNIEVKVQLEMPTAENASQILKTRLASNDAPDIFGIHAINEIPSFYKAGYIEDLSGQDFVEKILDNVKPAVTIDNKVVGVPLESLSWGYLYNKKIFADLGLTPPTTISEMKTVIDKLQENNITPFILSYKESWIAQLFLPLAVGGLINTENADFIERMNNDAGSFAEMKSMFDIIDLVNANGTDKALEVGGDDGAAAFATGKAAMWVQGPWYAETILQSNPDIEFGVAPLPINDNPDATMINLSVSTTLVISPESKNKELAIDFLNYMLDDEASNKFFESVKFSPLATVHSFEAYSWVNEATEYVKKGKSYQDPSMPQSVKDEVGKALQSYFAKQMSQDDVMMALDKTWKEFNKVNK